MNNLSSKLHDYSKSGLGATERLNASVDCTTTRTIDPSNVAAHSWRANLFNVSKYRKVHDPNTDNFSAL